MNSPNINSFIPNLPTVERPPNPFLELKKISDSLLEPPSAEKYTRIKTANGIGRKQGVKGEARGMSFDSYWEFAWYIYQTDLQNNVVNRNTTKCFTYINEDNEKAKFYPDFEMLGGFHEIKGIYRPNDLLKKEATLGSVIFWGPEEMKSILKEVYRKFPNWKDEYLEMKTQKVHYGKIK